MPELPDVEVFRRYIDSTSLHQNIETVEVKDRRILGGVSARELERELASREFISTQRHGKNLFVEVRGGGWLLLHFGMTGSLKYYKDQREEPTHARVLISFEGGYRLAFDDQRLFGKVDLIGDPDDFVREQRLGPDPLELGFEEFRDLLGERRGAVKSTLMNQRVLAGIGNIYSDEILFQSRLHPNTGVRELDDGAMKDLFEAINLVLRTAIERGAHPDKLPDSFLLSRRREGEDCPRGNGKIRKIKAAGRTAYYCPACQPEG